MSSDDMGRRDLRTVRSLTKLNTTREQIRDSYEVDQRNQLRDIEERTRQLK